MIVEQVSGSAWAECPNGVESAAEGRFVHQRLGQAFYNHFNLHKLADQTSLQGLYEADGEKASRLIMRLFHPH